MEFRRKLANRGSKPLGNLSTATDDCSFVILDIPGYDRVLGSTGYRTGATGRPVALILVERATGKTMSLSVRE